MRKEDLLSCSPNWSVLPFIITLTSHWTALSYKREPGESGSTNGRVPSFPPHSPVPFLCPLTVFTEQCWHHHSKQHFRTIIDTLDAVEPINNDIVDPITDDIRLITLITPITPTSHWKALSYKREPGESGSTNRRVPSFPPHSPVLFLCPLTVFTEQYWSQHAKQHKTLY